MTKDLFIKYLQGNCTESEFQRILIWIKEGALTSSGQGLIQDVWNDFEPDAGSEERIKYNRILDKIHHQINISQNPKQFFTRNTLERKRILSFFTKAAAILLLPVLSLLIYTIQLNKYSMNTNDLVVEAPAGSRVNFELGDGTKVWLNHGSKLKYPIKFNGESRNVFLTGEAYFIVAHDRKVPFVVGTSSLDIKAVGTAFNVSAYPEDRIVGTALVEGKVILYDSRNKHEIRALNQGEYLEFNNREDVYSVESENINKYTAWKEGRLVFRNDSLEDIAKKLARWFNVDVVISNKKAREFTYTATFTNETLAQVLDLMTLPSPVCYKLTEIRKLSDGSYTRQKVLIDLKENK